MGTSAYIYVIVPAFAWLVAQGLKYVINSVKTRNFKNTKPLHDSGRMPSAHSATTVSLATIVGLLEGFDSALFAIAATFAVLTMYDAVKVRRVVGEQGTLLQKIVAKVVLKDTALPRIAEGHKPIEVLVGALIGIAIALLGFLFVNPS